MKDVTSPYTTRNVLPDRYMYERAHWSAVSHRPNWRSSRCNSRFWSTVSKAVSKNVSDRSKKQRTDICPRSSTGTKVGYNEKRVLQMNLYSHSRVTNICLSTVTPWALLRQAFFILFSFLQRKRQKKARKICRRSGQKALSACMHQRLWWTNA